jgi:hypothetical protein
VQRWAEAAPDAQLKGMKTSLRLTADQEKDWGSFESAVKDSAKARVVALQKEQGNNLSPMDRLNAKAERLTQSTANLETIIEAAKPMYASLDETQKHTFITLGRMLMPERGRFAKEMTHRRVGERDQRAIASPHCAGSLRSPVMTCSTSATEVAFGSMSSATIFPRRITTIRSTT